MGPGWAWGMERQQSLDAKVEKSGDPSALNAQEVSVVDMFAEWYNPSMPAWNGGSSGWHYKDNEWRKNAKKKFQNVLGTVHVWLSKLSAS